MKTLRYVFCSLIISAIIGCVVIDCSFGSLFRFDKATQKFRNVYRADNAVPAGYTYVLVPDSLVGYQACINYHYPPSAEFQDGEWSWVAIDLK